VLGRATVRVRADQQGRAGVTLRFLYAPRAPQQVTLRVTVRTPRGTVTRSTPITITR